MCNTNSVVYVSTNDRYTQMRETFDSVEEFLDMCKAGSGGCPLLTRQPLNGVWVDERGETVLVEDEGLLLEPAREDFEIPEDDVWPDDGDREADRAVGAALDRGSDL